MPVTSKSLAVVVVAIAVRRRRSSGTDIGRTTTPSMSRSKVYTENDTFEAKARDFVLDASSRSKPVLEDPTAGLTSHSTQDWSFRRRSSHGVVLNDGPERAPY